MISSSRNRQFNLPKEKSRKFQAKIPDENSKMPEGENIFRSLRRLEIVLWIARIPLGQHVDFSLV